ncbi:IclR family transcriptional regulator [Nakamurella leprariae]|uniref:IclR family transcriptional regulator n=1 Tax=Nakamurella leprariae TaxID=2803911 RepID=A0A938YDV6_9ACTN|nr:IclR family transcriptional regulator [Nakamurella leprariae]MBM9467766.1 IclR family transcriptional regulator [Nakamurella leprariae]
MKNAPIQKRPAYPIESVDNALRIIQLLRDEGSVRLSDIAGELEIAASTAHRLMAMLVYRGFAMQDDNRRYIAGPAVGAGAIGVPWTRRLKQLLQPALELLCSELNETVNLMVRVGVSVRFLSTVEAQSLLRVGDRGGSVLPARSASGGKVLLAAEPLDRLQRLYRSSGAEAAGHALTAEEFDAFVAELQLVRRRGYALNREETEPGVGALGVAVPSPSGRPVASFSVAVPASRLSTVQGARELKLVFRARDDMAAALAEANFDEHA